MYLCYEEQLGALQASKGSGNLSLFQLKTKKIGVNFVNGNLVGCK